MTTATTAFVSFRLLLKKNNNYSDDENHDIDNDNNVDEGDNDNYNDNCETHHVGVLATHL